MRFITTFEEWSEQIRSGVPVLMFHKIGVCPARANMPEFYISPAGLNHLVSTLKQDGFQSVSMEIASQGQSPSSRRFTISFDDGYEGALKDGAECIRRCGFTAIQFLVADRLGQMNEWDRGIDSAMERLMDETQVREWLSFGHQIGAHTLTHPRLATIPLDRAREEIIASKKKLEDLFGIPVRHFAYPYGEYSDDIVRLVQEAGFETACTTQSGCVQSGADPLRLNRLTVKERKLSNWAGFKLRTSFTRLAMRGKRQLLRR
jgi:peptidoglycan/xylan/chitin deacetylase (PgdA/CDA1 family)